MRRLRAWLAGGARPAEDAVLVLVPSAGDLPDASDVIGALAGGTHRISTVAIAADAAEAGRIEARFPGVLARAVPAAAPAGAVLAALRVRAVLAVTPGRLGGRAMRLLRAARARGVPVYGLAAAPGGPALALDPISAAALTPSGLLDAAGAAAFLARATGVERSPRLSPDRLAARVARAGPGRVSAGFVRCIDGLDALAARLGRPETLLCLGNGPTSAAPEVAAFAHDALFRVNIDWRGGGVLTAPDMVFVGVKRAMRQLGPVPLGVATAQKEAALIACRLLEPWHGPAVYAVAERLAAGIAPPVPGPLKPTTGAWMLAVAVALAPTRLAIAGIDMFSHPEGAYPPGTDPTASGSANAFAAAHDRETDAAFIAGCLAHYAGELVVFSPALAALARARCAGARFRLVEPGGRGGA